jgi:hypothetical protein
VRSRGGGAADNGERRTEGGIGSSLSKQRFVDNGDGPIFADQNPGCQHGGERNGGSGRPALQSEDAQIRADAAGP